MSAIDPDGLERRRWQTALEHCGKGICCPVNTRHRPRCARRAARLAARRELWTPEIESFSEIGGRRGCIQGVAAIALITAAAMVFSW